MNKTELIKQMAKDAGITDHAAREAMQSIIGNITESLVNDTGKVTLSGFGTFSKNHREEHIGRNPMTGEPIRIAARNVVKFRAGKKLKEAV